MKKSQFNLLVLLLTSQFNLIKKKDVLSSLLSTPWSVLLSQNTILLTTIIFTAFCLYFSGRP